MTRSETEPPPLTYAAAGVDDEAARRFVERIRPLARSTHRPEVLAGVGPFAGLFRLGAYREPVLVASTDSVGTKVKIAALMGRYDTIGIDLVNQSVNDILTVGAEPLFFLDYIASATLSEDEKAALVAGVASACREAGCALIGGETATMPDLYAPGDFDFVGFIVGVVERDAIIDGSRIREGDALLALPSSGLHTNGYSLARRVFSVGVGGDPAAERARLERVYPELSVSLGEALLMPHRSYLRELRPLFSHLKGIAHITGGGAIEGNVARMLPEGLAARIDRSAWEVPAIFRLIQREGNVPEEEMWRTFNMGLGLVFAVDPADVAALRSSVPEALVVGEVVRAEGQERVRVEYGA
ncbi:MAG: phosphoribosylformylglycinamidine cyclo-ligase [Chloroflexi bacterium RBG_16_68_14]|nr:MAG: phosphoribosylformylglycinamidine cyclo-ligase [Chloroflexi bacterium RBG_16_68_14]